MKKSILLSLFVFSVFAASSQQQSKFQKSLTTENYKNYFMTDIQDVNIGINFSVYETIQLVCILPTQEMDRKLMGTANDYYTNYINSFYSNFKNIKYKIITDNEALHTDLSDCSIRTFGTQEGNLWTKWFLSQMSDFPIKIYTDSVVADKCYAGNNLHVYAVWFNPYNIKHGVILNIPQNLMCFEFPKGRDLSQFQIFKGEDNIAQTYYYHLKEGNWFISEKRDKLLEYKIEVGNKLIEQLSFKISSNKNQFINDNTTGLCDSIAPIIISTIPEFGDCNVDPELKEIIIKFDQEMATGMSVIDTRNMPNITDKPKWIDKKTFSIPVKLYQNRLYDLVFNNSKYNNFRSANGTPLNPYELIFKTKPISYAKKNKIAYQELLELFPKQYSYAKIKNIDWPKVLEENKKELEKSESNIEFAIKTVKLLKRANDPHLWVEVEGQRFETGKTNFITANNGSKKYWNLLEHKRIGNGFKYIAGNLDSIGYISITDWQTDYFAEPHKKFMDGNGELSADSVLSEMFKYPNLIIDIRDNRGGNESYAKKFAAYFAKDSTPYELVKYYNEETGNFDKEYVKKLYPNEMKKYSGNIYVISGPAVMSSNESFVLMMKQLPNSKIIGMKTYGSSGNPKPYELSNGVTIYLPSWQAYTLEGEMIEDNGIKPDIEINTTYEDFKETDPVIDKIIELTEIN